MSWYASEANRRVKVDNTVICLLLPLLLSQGLRALLGMFLRGASEDCNFTLIEVSNIKICLFLFMPIRLKPVEKLD